MNHVVSLPKLKQVRQAGPRPNHSEVVLLLQFDQPYAKLVAETVEHLGGVDVMIANAGTAKGGRFLDREFRLFGICGTIGFIESFTVNIDDFDRVVAVNLRGVMLCYQLAARQMVKQKRGGRLIGNTSS